MTFLPAIGAAAAGFFSTASAVATAAAPLIATATGVAQTVSALRKPAAAGAGIPTPEKLPGLPKSEVVQDETRRKILAARLARPKTLLTSGQGASGQPNVGLKTLLGG